MFENIIAINTVNNMEDDNIYKNKACQFRLDERTLTIE